MDPRERADALLLRAQERAGVVTPDNMVSPMDASNTQQIPGAMVRDLDPEQDPDTTTKLPQSLIENNDTHLNEQAQTTKLDLFSDSSTTTPLNPLPRKTPQSGGPRQEPSAGQPEPSTDVEDAGGLVPTTRTKQGKSELARRLEGL